MDKDKQIVPNQIGYLILNDDGALQDSGGDLKNDERSANVIMGLLNLTDRQVELKLIKTKNFNCLFLPRLQHR